MNKVILVGNLTRDPELITTTNGHFADFHLLFKEDLLVQMAKEKQILLIL